MPLEVRRLIRAMSLANPLLGAPRMHWRAGSDHRLRAGARFSAITLMGLLRWTCSWCQQFRFSFSMAC